jgi:CMP-N-acetylneuraminic acid synthetase
LIEWTIEAAKAAHVAQIIISSDDPAVWPIARYHQVELHIRKPAHATDEAPDIHWVLDVLSTHWPCPEHKPYVAILRPTSPFRTASTIRRAYAALVGSGADSIRAVERVSNPHPGKMWTFNGKLMEPVMVGWTETAPYHSSPTQSLPAVYAQNASLEMAKTASILATKTISGYRIAPFRTDEVEGFDINTEADFERAEALARDLETAGHGR